MLAAPLASPVLSPTCCASRPACPPQLVGLFLLVCFGSCMDIAAIQQDSPQRLDTNRELACIGGSGWGDPPGLGGRFGHSGSHACTPGTTTHLYLTLTTLLAGLSNVACGLIGTGFTGSFIFSQTLFTGRAGVHSRLNGAGLCRVQTCCIAAAPQNPVAALRRCCGTQPCMHVPNTPSHPCLLCNPTRSDCAVRAGAVCGALQHRSVRAHLLLRCSAGEPGVLSWLVGDAARFMACWCALCWHAHTHSSVLDHPNVLKPSLPPQVWFGLEICMDWCVHSYSKLTGAGELACGAGSLRITSALG